MATPSFNNFVNPSFFDSLPTIASTGPATVALSGNVFYVQSSAPAAKDAIATNGSNPLAPLKTLNYALSQCAANNGDVIFCLPGHVETVNAAAGLTFAAGVCDGVQVFFQGAGADRAQVNFTTSTAAQMTIPANNVSIWGMRCVASIDAIVAAISITGSDCTLTNTEYFDGTSILTTIQVLTTNAAKRLTINGYTYYNGTAGTSQTEAIRIVGGSNHRLENLNISGSFSTANVNNVTTATTDFVGRNWFLKNPLSTAVGVPLWTFVSTSTFLGPDAGPQAVAQGGEYVAAKTLALPQGTTSTVFTVIGGPIQILQIAGLVTTVIGAVANATKLTYTPTVAGTSTDLCATVDLNAAAAGDTLFLQTSFATAMTLSTNAVESIAQIVQEKLVYPLLVPPGALRVNCVGSDGGTGRIQWCMRYKPLAPGVVVI